MSNELIIKEPLMNIEIFLKSHIICPHCYFDHMPEFKNKGHIKYFSKNDKTTLECLKCKKEFGIFDIIKDTFFFIRFMNTKEKIISNNKIINGYIYILKMDNKYKIGKTLNVKSTIQRYKTNTIVKIDINFYFVKDYNNIELELHKKYKHKKIRNEWFSLSEEDLLSAFEFLELRKLENNPEILGDIKLKESLKDTGKKINEIINPKKEIK